MLRPQKTSIVINNFKDLVKQFPDIESWLKEKMGNESYTLELSWDDFENVQKIAAEYLEQADGEYMLMVNQANEQLMILELKPVHYLLTGELSGPNIKMRIGSKADVERNYISWAREHYHSGIAGVEDAKIFIRDNWDSANAAVIF